jgi:Arc/MetJ family transcription regulator
LSRYIAVIWEEQFVSRTLIDANDELLERARVLLGTTTKKDTVNAALAQVVALAARRQLVEDARAGQLDDALDPTVMDRAWRR